LPLTARPPAVSLNNIGGNTVLNWGGMGCGEGSGCEFGGGGGSSGSNITFIPTFHHRNSSPLSNSSPSFISSSSVQQLSLFLPRQQQKPSSLIFSPNSLNPPPPLLTTTTVNTLNPFVLSSPSSSSVPSRFPVGILPSSSFISLDVSQSNQNDTNDIK
jgi:hypothetical protein